MGGVLRPCAGGYAAAVAIPGPEEGLSTRPPENQAEPISGSRSCPFLLAEPGGWRLDVPSKDHRCTAVSPAAPLALDKQSRLCLTAAFTSCATYLASMEARGTRLGRPDTERATRWGLTRTTAVIEDAGGVRTRVSGALTDRGRWPAVPAVLLLTGLIVLGLSGLRGTPAAAVASPSPSRPVAIPSPTPRPTSKPSAAPASVPATEAPTPAPTIAPTRAPTPRPSVTPGESFRTYTVKSGDTLSAIASKYGTTSRAIADLNGFSVSKTLHIGDVLKIPNT
jgi:LysM repeat protein